MNRTETAVAWLAETDLAFRCDYAAAETSQWRNHLEQEALRRYDAAQWREFRAAVLASGLATAEEFASVDAAASQTYDLASSMAALRTIQAWQAATH